MMPVPEESCRWTWFTATPPLLLSVIPRSTMSPSSPEVWRPLVKVFHTPLWRRWRLQPTMLSLWKSSGNLQVICSNCAHSLYQGWVFFLLGAHSECLVPAVDQAWVAEHAEQSPPPGHLCLRFWRKYLARAEARDGWPILPSPPNLSLWYSLHPSEQRGSQQDSDSVQHCHLQLQVSLNQS